MMQTMKVNVIMKCAKTLVFLSRMLFHYNKAFPIHGHVCNLHWMRGQNFETFAITNYCFHTRQISKGIRIAWHKTESCAAKTCIRTLVIPKQVSSKILDFWALVQFSYCPNRTFHDIKFECP